jgi:predicted dehydrogenase
VSHPVRIALIGFGYWGPNYARVLSELPGADLVLVCDRSADRLALVANRHRAVPTCSRVDDVFARDDVDAVVIATPA